MNFEPTERAREYRERVQAFMDECVYPSEPLYDEQMRAAGDPNFHPPVIEELKAQARSHGLWNLFHSEDPYAPGLTLAHRSSRRLFSTELLDDAGRGCARQRACARPPSG